MAYKKYTVKKGDTLSEIAQKFGTTVKAIQAANKSKITNVNLIGVGWVLNIPVSEPSESVPKPSKDYRAIGKQYETALNDVRNLASVKKLLSMTEG